MHSLGCHTSATLTGMCTLAFAQVVVRRGEAISGPPGPILIATRNDDLQAIVDATPAERRQGGTNCSFHP